MCECLGTPAKSVGVGNAARNGLLSALLAAKDFTGPPEPLSGACKAITMRRTDANPMTDKNLEDKLRDAAAAAIPHNDSAALIDAIWTLDESDDISKLTALAVPRAN